MRYSYAIGAVQLCHRCGTVMPSPEGIKKDKDLKRIVLPTSTYFIN
ncbi:hypothetical protein TEQUI_0163 [Taylorella equigenitalis MCE9]|uniref:Uncharacterized protein n=1 Tax=Taylorella equigenitalis (strain MCE9) TaxID=937774 RepID=A0A654KFF6_TAYEM|nr:hypothetical protein TEQUI_0163 [Taylorella equigenitalis MCE9]